MKCSQLMFGTVALGVVYLITAAHCLTHEFKPGRNLKVGQRQPNDKELFKETITTQKSDTLPNISNDLTYPPESEPGDYLITLIELVDNGKSGFLNLTLGGMGSRFVVFNLVTQEKNPIEFQVIIYGYKYD